MRTKSVFPQIRRNYWRALCVLIGLSLLAGCSVMDGLMGSAGGSDDQPDAQTSSPADTGSKPGPRPGDPTGPGGEDGEGGEGNSPENNNSGSCQQACPTGSGCVEHNECIYPVKFSAGYEHLCAVFDDGSIWCRGNNESGQLGDDRISASSHKFVRVNVGAQLMPNDTFIDVAAGGRHSCALTEKGKVFCWGSNEKGQLGQGDTNARSGPVLVEAQGTLVGEQLSKIVAGREHTCVLTSDEYVYCWGDNSVTQLGMSGRIVVNQHSAVPVGPLQLFSETTGSFSHTDYVKGESIVSQTDHTCTFSPDSSGWYCWGANHNGQFGKTTNTGYASKVEWPLEGVLQDLATGAAHTCAVISTDSTGTIGEVYCWGFGINGRLGYDSNGNPDLRLSTTVLIKDEDAKLPANALALGEKFSCAHVKALDVAAAQVYCWGNGELGASAIEEFEGRGQVLQIDAQPAAICALIKSYTSEESEILCVSRGE